MTEDVYKRLAYHLSTLGMGYPLREDLEGILRENFSPEEAEIALAFPTRVAPLQPVGVDDIIGKVGLPRTELAEILERLSQRGLLFSGKTKDGEKGYALQQVGYGFPQTFFWKGEDTPHARNMANLVAKYFNRQVTQQAYGGSETKPHRYVPWSGTIEHDHGDMEIVYPYHTMEKVIEQARVFAVAHCPCRMTMRLRGRGCDHPLEVCLKFDDMAQYLIERGLAREITREEALKIVKKSEEAGLVHFVENAMGNVKHNCNCCGCSCWNVGSIKRRKIPRDAIMATYFIRYTDEEECVGCGDCIEVCPVDALTLEEDFTTVDEEWCIGCGICVAKCSNGAAKLRLRADRVGHELPRDFDELCERILKEKGLK